MFIINTGINYGFNKYYFLPSSEPNDLNKLFLMSFAKFVSTAKPAVATLPLKYSVLGI